MDILIERDELELSLQSTKSWLRDFQNRAIVLTENGMIEQERTEHLLEPYAVFLDETLKNTAGLKSGETKLTNICGQEYSMQRQDVDGFSVPAYTIFPAGEQAPVNTYLFRRKSDRYTETYLRFMSIDREFGEIIPSPLTIFTPEIWTVNGIQVNRESMVNDFGPAVFHFTNGTNGLTGRFGGNDWHESVHRRTAIDHTRVYLNYLMHHPYVNESLAEAVAILEHQPEELPGGLMPENYSNPVYNEIPIGNALKNSQQITVGDILNPIDFKTLDGKGKYTPKLYVKRFPLIVFMAIISSADKKSGSVDENYYLDLINSGLDKIRYENDMDNSLMKKGILNIVRTLDELEDICKNDGVNGDVFWQTFLNNNGVSERQVEEIYKRTIRVVYPLYFRYRDGNVPIKVWWQELDPILKKEIDQNTQDFTSIMKDIVPFLPHFPLKQIPR